MTDELPPIMTGIFTLPPYDREPPQLLGGFCPGCDRYYFPRPKYCPACLNPAEEKALGSTGVIYSYTIVRKKAPFALPLPYGVGFVDLDGCGLRIFSLFDPELLDRIRIGASVKLSIRPLGLNGDGNNCLRPLFTPLVETNTADGGG